MKYLIVIIALALAGCEKKAESAERVNSQFTVEKLFTNNGCTIYRFYDGRNHYYSDCRGSVSNSWTERCGKGCTRTIDEDVETVR